MPDHEGPLYDLAADLRESEENGPDHPLTEAVEDLATIHRLVTSEGWDADTADLVAKLAFGAAENLASYAGGGR